MVWWQAADGSLDRQLVAPAHKLGGTICGFSRRFVLEQKSEMEIINDLSDDVVNFFRVLRDPEEGKKLQALLALTPYSRTEHDEANERPHDGDRIEQARKFFIRVRQSYGGIVGEDFAISFVRPLSHHYTSTIDGLDAVIQRLRNVKIECQDWKHFLNRVPDRKGIVIYCDPPYPQETRTRSGKTYEHELSDEDHLSLLERLKRYEHATVAISGYQCPMYEQQLATWKRYDYQKHINMAAQHGRDRKDAFRTESIWIKNG